MSQKPPTPRARRSSSRPTPQTSTAAELEDLKAQNARLLKELSDRQQAEDERRINAARFYAFVEHATDAFFLHDDTDVLLEVNPQACVSLGYTHDELIGLSPFDFDPDVTQCFL